MKTLAFYLPQFHEIPENNDAWGNGFTEWTNVKKAKKYYDWQRQPRVPLHENYYNLLDKDVMKWQAKLACDAGIDGFCMYHYWFHGRMVLEKPLYNLLADESIKMNFCLAWANEPWTKTWHGAGGAKEIMIPQTYGGEEEWMRHYKFFRPFFMDSRYLKEDGAPILLIYRMRNIPDFNHMIRYWKKCAKEDGLSGVYVISMNVAREHVYMSRWIDGSVDFEPNRTKYSLIQNMSGNGLPVVLDYNDMCKEMLSEPHKKNHYRTVFVDYDDTPRRKEHGICMNHVSIAAFEDCLVRSVRLTEEEGNGYLFLNAWKEWGESNYLEPDEDNGNAYLDAVRKVLKNTK